jgi:TolB-like protein/Tfp pilus assembly protein PilF
MAERRFDQALQELARVPESMLLDRVYHGPKALLAGFAHQAAGRNDVAQSQFRDAERMLREELTHDSENQELRVVLALNLAALGRSDDARRELAAIEALLKDQAPTVYSGQLIALMAQTHGLLGDQDALRHWLRRILAEGTQLPFTPASLRFDARFSAYLADPEMQKLLKEFASLDQPKEGRSAVASDDKSVAVLAFTDLSAAHDGEYFSDGISEELINALGKVPGLKVPARTSSFYFKNKSMPMPEIAKQLGVAYVIEGSVQRAGNKVKISERLSKAADGFQVWTDSFLRDAKDVFAVEEEIAGLIAKQLSLKLGASSTAATAMVKPEAFELYVQARQAIARRDVENFDRAEQLLGRALEIEPGLARAHAALADVWALRANLLQQIGYFGQRDAPVFARIEAEIEKALADDPDSAEAQASLGFARLLEWKLADAERALRRAVALNPNYPTGHHWLGTCLTNIGWIEEGLAEYRRAADLDPFSFRILENYGNALNQAGRRSESLLYLNRALELQPKSTQALVSKVVTLSDLNCRAEAIAIIRELPESSAKFLLAGAGMQAEAEAALAKASGRDRNTLLAGLNRYDEWLDAITPADIYVMSTVRGMLLFDGLDPIRHDARFTKLLATLGLTEAHARAQAWRKTHPPETPEARR